MNSDLPTKEEILLTKQSHIPPLTFAQQMPIVKPKGNSGCWISIEHPHALPFFFSLWKCCNTDPTETLCVLWVRIAPAVYERDEREIRAPLFPFGVMQLSRRRRNQTMGSSKDTECSCRQVWVSGYLYWHETTKLNSVQLNPPFCVLKVPLFQSRHGGKINSVCIDIHVQRFVSK